MNVSQRSWTLPKRHRVLLAMATLCVTVGYGASGAAQESKVATHVSPDAMRAAKELLDRRVTMRVTHVSLEKAIDTLARAANVLIEYEVPVIDAYTTPVSLEVDATPLGVALDQLLNGTALRVVAGRNSLTIVAASGAADSTTHTGGISGRVVDSASGRGIAGATVRVAGTKLSAVTSDSGRFAMRNIPVGDQLLTIKGFGYRPAERTVTVRDGEVVTTRVFVSATPNVLTGVVTTATGVQERRSVGNDITVLNADSILRIAPVRNLTDLLETRVPGLTVIRTSGTPGAPSRLRLRGIGSGLTSGVANTSNDPIVYIDGVRVYAQVSTPRDQNLAPNSSSLVHSDNFRTGTYLAPSAFDQIDPNSIETIEIFKGPSATSQWGADAGNGVIVITTKRGKSGTTQVSAVLDAGVERMPGQYVAPVYYPFGQLSYFNEGIGYCGVRTDQCISVDTAIPFQAANAPRLSPFGTGTSEGVSATVSGGSAALTYALTASTNEEHGYFKMPEFYQDLFADQYGTRPPLWMRRPAVYRAWSVNSSTVITPTTGLRVNLVGSFSNSTRNQTSAVNGLTDLSSVYIDTTTTRRSTYLAMSAVGAYVERSTDRTSVTTMSASGDWSRWTQFPVTATGGVSTNERYDRVLSPFGIQTVGGGDTLGKYSLGHGTALTRSGTVGMTLFRGAPLATNVGIQITKTTTEDFNAFKDTLQAGESSPAIFSGSGQNSYATTTAGWYIEPRFKPGSRLSVAPGFRFDGGSATSGARRGNGRDGILAFFPKFDFSWIAVDREGERPLFGMITLLRPRLGFGVAGVQPDPSWNRRLLTTHGATDGAELLTLGNTKLRPERSREFESGFEVSFWDGRANITASYFEKLRTDAIESVPTAPSVNGGVNYFTNIGKVRNTGVNLSFDARLIERGAFAWGVNAILTASQNRVMSLYQGIGALGQGSRIVQGYPIDGLWARPIIGYHDANGDGRLTLSEVAIADSVVYLGAPYPKAEIPFGTNISLWHGQLGVTANFDYKSGITQNNIGSAWRLANIRWDPTVTLGQQAVAVTAQDCGQGFPRFLGAIACDAASTLYGVIQTVSELRFNSLSVNYTVPHAISTRLRIPRMSVAVQGSNLGLWTNYRGKDPDVNASLLGETLLDAGQAPLARSWSLRFTLGN